MNLKKIAAFAVGPIGGAALGFITLPIITWYFSAEDVGRISMLQVVTSFAALLFSLGLDQAYVREYHETKNKPQLLKATLLPGFVILALALTGCLALPGFISDSLFSVNSVSISFLVALCLLAAFVSRFLSLILRMQEKGMAYSMSQLLPKLIFLLVIGAYSAYAFSFDLLHLVIAHTVSITTVTLVYAWNTRADWFKAISQQIDILKLKAMLSFGAPLILGGAAFWGLTTMDKLFLRNMSSFEELGIYSVASSFAAAAIIFQNIFSTVWAPTVYKWAAEGINAQKIDQVTEHVLATVVFFFVLAGLFSWLVPYLLPDSYDRVQYILVTCMAFPLFYTLSETTVVGLGITRKSSHAMLASALAALINFIGNYLLTPKFGATGAAISTALAFWAFLILRTEFSCLAWRKIPRSKIYISTFFCLTMTIATPILGSHNSTMIFLSWISLGVASIFIFRNSLNSAKTLILNKYRLENNENNKPRKTPIDQTK